MATSKRQSPGKELWRLVRAQHGVVSRDQLLECGLGPAAIRHRVATARLHRIYPTVYAVGRPDLTQHGKWMAAVLAAGPGAVLSHESAAALWRIRNASQRRIDVTVPAGSGRRSHGNLRIHRRDLAGGERARREGIPLTSPLLTLVDLAAAIPQPQLEAAINEADKRDLTDPDAMRLGLVAAVRRPGTAALARALDRATFTLTDSDLERRFLKIVRQAGLPKPKTQGRVNGFRVDFYWPDLKLVVETDGLRYHRTPTQQARDRLRDQRHTAGGLTPLRFTHAQVAHEPRHVQETLKAVVALVR